MGSGRTKVLERSYAVLGPPPTPSTRRHRRSRSGGRGGSSRWCRTASSDRDAPRRREKLRTDIHFPRRGLDLSRFLPADAYAVYDLFGVINHLVPTRRPFPRPLHDRQSVDASRVPRRGASRAVTILLMSRCRPVRLMGRRRRRSRLRSRNGGSTSMTIWWKRRSPRTSSRTAPTCCFTEGGGFPEGWWSATRRWRRRRRGCKR